LVGTYHTGTVFIQYPYCLGESVPQLPAQETPLPHLPTKTQTQAPTR
jgi:hypothetical protein